jgi:hypothetical protein
MKGMRALVVSIAVVIVVAASVTTFYYIDAFDTSSHSVDRFFRLLKEGRNYDAYRECAAILRTNSFERFERSIETIGLDRVSKTIWNSKTGSSAGTEKTYAGEVELSNGSSVPLTVKLVREAGGWRIFELHSDQRPLLVREEGGETKPEDAVPNKAQLESLVLDTLVKFNEAVQIRYFGPFYQSISATWQRQTSSDELQSAFQAFLDNRINFGAITRHTPVFTVPGTLTPENLLEAQGHYLLPEYKLGFKLRYIYERGKWRLFAINLDISSPEPPPSTEDPASETVPLPVPAEG